MVKEIETHFLNQPALVSARLKSLTLGLFSFHHDIEESFGLRIVPLPYSDINKVRLWCLFPLPFLSHSPYSFSNQLSLICKKLFYCTELGRDEDKIGSY